LLWAFRGYLMVSVNEELGEEVLPIDFEEKK